MDARKFVASVGSEVKGSFVQNRMILSLEEYLELFFQEPRRASRNAAQYLKDVFDFYGGQALETPVGKIRRFGLFDQPFDGSEGMIAGQEEVHAAIYRVLANFVRIGRINKLILLHGPNGSAKSSITARLMNAMEDYSRRPEGAMYRFNWVFPSDKLVKGSIGFADRVGAGIPVSDGGSFAHLSGEALDAKIVCDMKDHPLFLIPRKERKALLEEHCRAKGRAQGEGAAEDFLLSDFILDGELCQKCRAIYSALLTSTGGDYHRVLRHVQVERFHISRRYQVGAVTVEPQMSVDATYHQVTADHSHANLPPALHNLSLFEPFGPLVASNRGIIEYSDLLKRPLEAFKYLLGTSETGVVALDHFLLHLDQVLIASSNEKHLAAFKEIPDFASFRGRLELIRVPYLRRFSAERRIYEQRVTVSSVGRHVAPHAIDVAAMWAVLTRLKKPIPDRYQGELRDLVDDLSPTEKLGLYDEGQAPDRLALAQAKELKKHLPEIYEESDAYPNYEGRSGASAREIKTVLFNAAQHPDYRCLTPLAVLEELQGLCKDKSVYEFLQQEVVDGYHDHEEFVRTVEAYYLDLIDEEIRDSMGLISESQYREMFGRYVQHVSHWTKGEKIRNKVTGEYQRPDEDLMVEVEKIVMPEEEDRGDFRRGLISTIGAYRLDHPEGTDFDYSGIFPDLFRRIRDHYFDERKKTLRKNKENVLKYLSDEKTGLSAKELAAVESTMQAMTSRYGYCQVCAQDAILFLMRRRYAD